MSRTVRNAAARCKAHKAAEANALRSALHKLRMVFAARALSAAREYAGQRAVLRSALGRFVASTRAMAAGCAEAAALTERAMAPRRERCARLCLQTLWRWRAYAVAVSALSPPTGAALRARRRQRVLTLHMSTWAKTSATRASHEGRIMQCTRTRLHRALLRMHRLAAASAAACAILRVQRLVSIRRAFHRAFPVSYTHLTLPTKRIV